MRHVTRLNKSCCTHTKEHKHVTYIACHIYSMSHIYVGCVTHVNGSYHTCERVTSRTGMSDILHILMSHIASIWMSHVTHFNLDESCHAHQSVDASRDIYINVMTLILTPLAVTLILISCWLLSHVTRMNESRHTHKRVMPRTWKRVLSIGESYHIHIICIIE